MLSLDEDALACDFAETYHIYDVRTLSALQAAVFAYGLRASSRIKMKLRGEEHSQEEMIQVLIFDKLNQLTWLMSADGHQGINHPEMLFDKLYSKNNNEDNEVVGYDSPEEFEKARKEMIDNGNQIS